MAESGQIRVTVACAPEPRVVREWCVSVPVGTEVRGALQASGVLRSFPELAGEGVVLAIWGRKVEWSQTLRDRDRIEFLRGLEVDPKVARRERFRKQGARATGLFANRRSGAKPGY